MKAKTRKQKFALRHQTTERLAKQFLDEGTFANLGRCRTEAKKVLQGKLGRA